MKGGDILAAGEWWAAEWYSVNRLDGETRYFLSEAPGPPSLFKTRAQCREWIKKHYGYIAHRPDLRAEPHGWRMPRAVRAKVVRG